MTIKNIFRLSLLAAAVVTLNTACSFEQEEYFDESASLRVSHLNEQIQQRLVSQSSGENHGWLIQYFVAGTDEETFEGFNLFGRFYDNGKVTLAGNHRFLRNGHAGKYTEYTSGYDMLAEEGPVLSFNTWNDVLTVFEEPVDPSAAPATLIPDGEGMNGDHNLVLTSYEENEIKFRGERHAAEIRFLPCDRPWEEYIQAIDDTKNMITSESLTNYYVTNGTDTMYITGLNDKKYFFQTGRFYYCDRLNDPLVKKKLSCVFTLNGFRLNHVDSLKENAFQEFMLDDTHTKLLSEDGKTQVIACWDTYILNHTSIWKLDVNEFSDEQKALYDQIATEVKKHSSAWTLESIGIGQSTGGNAVKGLVLTFYTNAAKKTNTIGLAMSLGKPAFGQLSILTSEDSKTDANMKSVNKKASNMEALVRSFATTLNGVYEVTPDDCFSPTGALCTPISGGTKFNMQE